MLRGLVVWLLIVSLETVHGILRAIYLAPLTGETVASRIGWPIAAVIVVVASLLLIDWTGLRANRQLLLLGIIWAALTLLFEIGIGIARGLNFVGIIADFNPAAGGLSAFSILLMLLAPLLASKMRARIAHRS